MIYPNLIRAAVVYSRALYSDLCFSHCTPLLSVLLFPHSHSVTICMLMTPSCSCPSSPPSSMKIFLACKLLLVPSLTGWLQTSSASTVLKPNFCYLVSNPNWTKFTIQHLPSVMVLQSVPHPQLAILVSSLMPISPFPIRFLHLLAHASTTSGISDAYALSLTSVQPTPLAHHSYSQSSITATLWQAELTFIHLLISLIRIVDISNSNCWYQQFELLISVIFSNYWYQQFTQNADINNWNCWYQQFQLLISTIVRTLLKFELRSTLRFAYIFIVVAVEATTPFWSDRSKWRLLLANQVLNAIGNHR